MLIGLTGGYCAGKNEVATILERKGWTCIDVDALGHEAIELARDAIVGRFGEGTLLPDGRVDRRAVARIVFADPVALADQEAIVHPIAIRLADERIAAALSSAREAGREARVCINAALLHRAPQAALCDAIIEVRAPLIVRLARGMRRDAAGPLATLRRITRQRDFRGALRALARAQALPIAVLRNCLGRGALEAALSRVLAKLVPGG